jgi:hypothetical protein
VNRGPRAAQLDVQYADLGLGFVDASVIATCETLGETKVATLDRRHVVRPRHCDALTLLPGWPSTARRTWLQPRLFEPRRASWDGAKSHIPSRVPSAAGLAPRTSRPRVRPVPDTGSSAVSKPFGTREGTVWVAVEPRRMETRREVTAMHAAITRARVMFVILAAVAAISLGLGIAPIETSTAMPVACPPNC